FSRKFDLVFGIVNSLPENGKDGEIIEAEKIKVMIMEKNSEWKQNEYKDKCKEYTDTYDENGLIEKIMLKEEIYRYIKDKINDEIRHPSEYKDLLSSDKNSGIKGIFWFSPLIHKKRYEKILIPKEKGKKFKFSEQEYKDFKYIIKQRRKRLEKNENSNSSYYEDKLKKGEPILCLFEKENDEKIVHLAFSEVPRLRYKLSPLNLVPPEFRPSNSLEKLSFSEKLFGTTGNHHENTSKEKENKKMTSMSGRVFFSDAKICDPNNPKMVKGGEAVTLKPFGEPHPTLFNFYLYKGDYDNSESRIRGRKFYWHHKDKINNDYKNYGKSIEAEKRKTNSDLELMNYGNEFEFEVYFERLTDEELGVLIYGLELEENMAHKIGKGKAFGFGSSKIIIEELLFENKEKKYKCFSKEEIYQSQKKEKFLRIAKEKYITEEENIKELKAILNIENKIENTKNNLDFSESPFPEETKGKNKEKNTLNWFINNKGIKLLKILDEFSEKKNDNNKN
ncbi:MAG: TIGR03986 family CRISPR-associated RAMP protein, partial [Leptotrichiaceae bacterium]|nr:TIGR03986 family CRISPR-associated RAMP protein [Leptotrichiaceae bacterium]